MPSPESAGSGSCSDSTPASEGLAAAKANGAEQVAAARMSEPTVKLRPGYIVVLLIAYLTLYMAWIAPLSFSLAIRIEQIDSAAKNTALALAIGVPGILVLITGPLFGVLSDRTRSRFGRRRPWFLFGTILGFLGSIVVGVSPSIVLTILGWCIAYVGYTAAGGMVFTHLGDKLPEDQRGRVAGFTGAVTQIGPVLGVVLAGMFATVPVAMLLVPAAVALVGGLIFVFVMKDSQTAPPAGNLDLKAVLEGFWFNPRRHKNFAWVWISRALIFLALSFMSVYVVYLLSERLHLDAGAIATLAAVAGGAGVLVGVAGALLSGWLSDRLRQRKSFILGSGLLLAIGLIVTATVTSIPQYFVGSLLSIFAIGAFSAVDQAIALDVLPQEEGQNGRYLAIFGLANQVAQAVGPFLAGAVIGIAGGDYTWVYLTGAVFAAVGGLLILPVRIARHAKTSTGAQIAS